MPNSIERAWLARFSRAVRDQLDAAASDPLLSLTPPARLRACATDTDGWYVAVGTVRGVRGELQVWLDSWVPAPWRTLSVAFMSKRDEDLIRQIARVGTGALRLAATLGNADWESRQHGFAQLRRPLPSRLYRRPIAEVYPRSWHYYAMYWSDRINPRQRPKARLVGTVVEFLTAVVRAVSGVAMTRPHRAYPGERNRAVVAEHLRRDRSRPLGQQAKIRDSFTCKVCGIYFAQLYGSLGRGFAEVHHRVPLASLQAPTTTQLKDLITVCANCHRMLHRMAGKANDVKTLKQRFTGKWPRQQ